MVKSLDTSSTKPNEKLEKGDPSQTLDAAPRLGERVLNVLHDAPDLRDKIYEPSLLDLALTMPPPESDMSPVRNQFDEGACTGFALSSAITLMNKLRHQKLETPVDVLMASPRMLYEMAKINDEWPGENYEGSSIRGALKGFYNNGVCSEHEAPFKRGEHGWYLKKDQAEDAREIGLGAYYRLRPEIIDYHAALNEVGVIYVSAEIHQGWRTLKKGEIGTSNKSEGGHAFIIVGYDRCGFLVQNSWGEEWGGFNGRPGIARWHYEDWAATIMDAWVLRLSVPTPDAFDLTRSDPAQKTVNLFRKQNATSPRGEEVIGHLIHLNDGKLVARGKYPTPITTIQETANFLADEKATANKKYKHLVFYAHGGLNNAGASANRVRKMKEVFKRNGIYPIHFMWETGFFESFKDIVFNSEAKAKARVGGFYNYWDRMLENLTRKSGRAMWRDMKLDGERSFVEGGGGRAAVKLLLDGNAKRNTPLKVHIVGHSAGSIFLGHMLKSMDSINPLKEPIRSCSLMAPACTIDYFERYYKPLVGKKGSASAIANLWQYNLIDQRELDDTTGPYRKSLLYWVSNAFEDQKKMPLLGMEKFSEDLTSQAAHKIHYAGRVSTITNSNSHGGFDNDRATMNNILKNILGRRPTPANGFQREDVTGY